MKKHRILKIVLLIFSLIIIAGACFLFIGLNTKNVAIANIDIAQVSDGTYTGKYSAGRFSNEVSVTVKGGKITDIRLLKDVAVSLPGMSEKLFQNVIASQSLVVDAISGATVMTKAYLKAIEDALR